MKKALKVVEAEIGQLNENIQKHIAEVSGRPLLAKIASYFFKLQGKRLRPVIVLLTAKATFAHLNPDWATSPAASLSSSTTTKPNAEAAKLLVNERQMSLAEIMEMIHTASLIHDDILDEADTRRGVPTTHKVWGSKKAVLAGDFLLARASVKIARLREHEVTELLSTVIADLVQGEFYQLPNSDETEEKIAAALGSGSTTAKSVEHVNGSGAGGIASALRLAGLFGSQRSSVEDSRMWDFDYYMRKTYLKTASLIEKCSSCSAILAGVDRQTIEQTALYGRHLGYAFQLVDDVLDYTGTSQSLGKPAAVDLSLGLATAPALFAMEQFPEMKDLIRRQFREPGDVERALELVRQSDGIERTLALAKEHCGRAVAAISHLAPSPARDGLIGLTEKVLTRSH